MAQSGRILRWAPWLLSVALFLLCVWLVFGLIDQAVTLSYLEESYRMTKGRHDLLLAVVNDLLPGTDESEMRQRILAISTDEPFDKGDEGLVADQVMFVFKDGVFLRAE